MHPKPRVVRVLVVDDNHAIHNDFRKVFDSIAGASKDRALDDFFEAPEPQFPPPRPSGSP